MRPAGCPPPPSRPSLSILGVFFSPFFQGAICSSGPHRYRRSIFSVADLCLLSLLFFYFYFSGIFTSNFRRFVFKRPILRASGVPFPAAGSPLSLTLLFPPFSFAGLSSSCLLRKLIRKTAYEYMTSCPRDSLARLSFPLNLSPPRSILIFFVHK